MTFGLWEENGGYLQEKVQLKDGNTVSRVLTDRFGLERRDEALQKLRLFEVPSDDHVSYCERMRYTLLQYVREQLTACKDAGSSRGVLARLNLSPVVLLVGGTAYRDRGTETIKFAR